MKKIFIYAPVVLACIIIMHFYRMSDDDSATIAYIFGTYIYSPLIAFGTLIDSGINWSGDYTLRFINAINYKIGISSVEPVKTILDYVYIPSPTNVYSVMQPFYSDMGIYGVAFGAMIYGVLLSAIYSSAKSGNLVMLGLYSILSVSLITQFMSETIITNLSGNIKLLLCMFVVFRFFTKKMNDNKNIHMQKNYNQKVFKH
ncbi:bacteriophage HK620 O-antigen modification protein [Escherichia coli]|uniref:Bacteriophage HK620 O-antigen modification protein n=8 Tax=Enterobacteriaceae TaxID=543 RepID=A0A377BV68_ECOLX|nr:bacteriophage HK620 O-antigen modification protein [Escherichia coli]